MIFFFTCKVTLITINRANSLHFCLQKKNEVDFMFQLKVKKIKFTQNFCFDFSSFFFKLLRQRQFFSLTSNIVKMFTSYQFKTKTDHTHPINNIFSLVTTEFQFFLQPTTKLALFHFQNSFWNKTKWRYLNTSFLFIVEPLET